MPHHLNLVNNPPFQINDRVRPKHESGEWANQVFRIVGIRYEYRQVPHAGWGIEIATDEEIMSGLGSTDGFAPQDLERVSQ